MADGAKKGYIFKRATKVSNTDFASLCSSKVSATIFCDEIAKVFPIGEVILLTEADMSDQFINDYDGNRTSVLDTLLSNHSFCERHDIGFLMTKITKLIEHGSAVSNCNMKEIFRKMFQMHIETCNNSYLIFQRLCVQIAKQWQIICSVATKVIRESIQCFLDIYDEEVDSEESSNFERAVAGLKILTSQIVNAMGGTTNYVATQDLVYSVVVFCTISEFKCNEDIKFVKLMEGVLPYPGTVNIYPELPPDLKENGKTILHWTAILDSPPLLTLLLSNQETKEIRDKLDNAGNSPLFYAKSPKMTAILLDSVKCDVNLTNNRGCTCLVYKLLSLLGQIVMNEIDMNVIQVCQYIANKQTCDVSITSNTGDDAIRLTLRCCTYLMTRNPRSTGRESASTFNASQKMIPLLRTLLGIYATSPHYCCSVLEEFFTMIKASNASTIFSVVQEYDLLTPITNSSCCDSKLLHEILKEKYIAALIGLLKIPAFNVNSEDSRGESLLAQAIEIDNVDVVNTIVKHPTFDHTLYDIGLLLHRITAGNRPPSMLQALITIQGLPSDSLAEAATIPLQIAFENCKWECVSLLCKIDKVDINIYNESKMYLPLELLQQNHSYILKEVLINRPGIALQVSEETEKGDTLLHIAVRNEEVDIVKHLLKVYNIFHLNQVNKIGQTPLCICMSRLFILVKNGMDTSNISDIASSLFGDERTNVNIKSEKGEPLVHQFVRCKTKDASIDKLLPLLLSHPGLQVNMYDQDDNTALHVAVTERNTFVMKCLLEHKHIDLHARNGSGHRPLSLAVRLKDTDLVKMLLDHPDADVNETDSSGQPAVFEAVNCLVPRGVKAFLSHPSYDPTVMNEYNQDINDVFEALPEEQRHPKLKALIRHATQSWDTPLKQTAVSPPTCRAPPTKIRMLLGELQKEVKNCKTFRESDQQELMYRLDHFENALDRLESNPLPNHNGGMKKEHQEALLRKHVFLLEEIEPGDVLNHLLQDGIIDMDMADHIEAEKTRKARVAAILKILPRRGPRAFECFVKALKESHQDHVAMALFDRENVEDEDIM